MQLKTGELHHGDVWWRGPERNLRERRTDISCGDRIDTERTKHMRDQRRHGALAVGAGDGHDPRVGEGAERNLHFTHDRHAGRSGPHQWWRVGRHAWADHGKGGVRNPLQIVPACLGLNPECAQLGGRVLHSVGCGRVGGIHAPALAMQQSGHRNAAAREADHGRLTVAHRRHPHYLSFSVPSATNAQKMPRIQKRTTTLFSGQPRSSK